MALQHTGEAVFHFCGWRSEAYPYGSSNVSGTVEILSAAVDQIDAVGFNRSIGAFINLVMAVRAVGARG